MSDGPRRVALSQLSIQAMIFALDPSSLLVVKEEKKEEPVDPRPMPEQYIAISENLKQRYPHCLQEIKDFLEVEHKQNAIDQGLDPQRRLIVNSRRDMAWKNFLVLLPQLNTERHNILVREKKRLKDERKGRKPITKRFGGQVYKVP